MKVIAPKTKGKMSIIAPKPQSGITPDHFAEAFGATSAVALEKGRNPLHAWQETRERLIRIANEAERGKIPNVTGMTDKQYLDRLLSE